MAQSTRDVGMSDVPATDLPLSTPAPPGTVDLGVLPEVNVTAKPPTPPAQSVSDTTKPTSTQESWQNAPPLTATGQPATIGGGQWLRQIKLTVYASTQGGNATDGLDLSQFRINFAVEKKTGFSPNVLKARVYNLSKPDGPNTVGKVRQYGRVQLAAGYLGEGNLGMIFDGDVILYIVGKENPTDSYLEIIAGDGDLTKNHGVAALTWPPGSTPSQRNTDMLKVGGYQIGQVVPAKGEQKAIRGVSYIGMVDRGIRANTNATQSDFFVDDGKAYIIPWSGYRAGDVVNLSPTTGLIGIPKVTPNGIEAQCLLNPKLRIGGLVKIDSQWLSDVPFLPGAKDPYTAPANAPLPTAPGFAGGYPYSPASVSPTGIYKILMLTHAGDTRGNEWYSNIVGAIAGANGNIIMTANPGTALTRAFLPPGSADAPQSTPSPAQRSFMVRA